MKSLKLKFYAARVEEERLQPAKLSPIMFLDGDKTQTAPDKVGVVNSQGELLYVGSTHYSIFQHAEALRSAKRVFSNIAAEDKNFEIFCSGNQAKMMVIAKTTITVEHPQDAEKKYPLCLVVKNSIDGSWELSFKFAVLIDGNYLILPEKEVSFRHRTCHSEWQKNVEEKAAQILQKEKGWLAAKLKAAIKTNMMVSTISEKLQNEDDSVFIKIPKRYRKKIADNLQIICTNAVTGEINLFQLLETMVQVVGQNASFAQYERECNKVFQVLDKLLPTT